MKTIEYHWDHPALQKHVKTVEEGTFLFRQGDPGSTLFIITQGIAELIAYRERQEFIVGFLEAGQFLGEKAIIKEKAQARAFSARAKSKLTVLELGMKDINTIQKTEPALMNDILKSIFLVAAQRLERGNDIIHLLRSSNNVERLVHLILFFARTFGRDVPNGRQFLLSVDSIRYYLDLGEYQITEYLDEMVRMKLLIKEEPRLYLLPNDKALIKSLPKLKDLPTLTAI